MRFLITGIFSWEEAEKALARGASALGHFFYGMDNAAIENIRFFYKKIPPFVSKAGLFENMPRYAIEELVTFLDLDTIIFLGNEDKDFLKRWYGQKIIKKLHCAQDYTEYFQLTDAFLIDNRSIVQECKIEKPLVVTANSLEEYQDAVRNNVWAVHIDCNADIYQEFINGRI